MKKNKMMRLASGLLVAVLLTTSMISGTFAKYVTEESASDSARVAYWGFQSANSLDLTKLFTSEYTNVKSVDDKDVIAPGTSGTTTFKFAWDEKTSYYNEENVVTDLAVTGPEVAYTFEVNVEDRCLQLIKDNKNIQWKLDDGSWGTWDAMVAAIKALSGEADGSKVYTPNTLPEAFSAEDKAHTISWQWLFEGTETYTVDGKTLTQDEYDTYMGNAQILDDCSLTITITATQID